MTIPLYIRALPLIAACAWAQNAVNIALPDTQLLVRDAIAHEQLALAVQQDYVVIEEDSLVNDSGDCVTDPGHRDPTPELTGYCQNENGLERRNEILWIDGVRISRLLHTLSYKGQKKVDTDLSPEERNIEEERINKDIAEARLHGALKTGALESEKAGLISMARVLELGKYSNPRRAVVGGRSAIVLDYSGNPAPDAKNPLEAALAQFIGTVTIDEKDRALRRFEGYFLNEVKARRNQNLYVHKYSQIQLENVRMDDSLWLPSCVNMRGDASYGDFKLHGGDYIRFHDYRKFRVSVQISTAEITVPENASPAHPPSRNQDAPLCLSRVNAPSLGSRR